MVRAIEVNTIHSEGGDVAIIMRFISTLACWLLLTLASWAVYPTVHSFSSGTANSVTSASGTVVLPATISANDEIVVVAYVVTGVASTVTAPGFSTTFDGNTALENISVLTKTATGTEGGTSVTITWSGGTGRQNYVAYAISGAKTAVAPQVSALAPASGTTPVSASLTPSWGSMDTLWLDVIAGTTSVAATVSSYPSGFGLGQTATQNSGSTTRITAGAGLQQTIATQSPGPWTVSSGFTDGAAITIGLQPAVQTNYPSINIPILGM